MEQDKLNQILYNIATTEYDIFGLINTETDTFEMLHNKSNNPNLKDKDTYHTTYEYVKSIVISDMQKETLQNTFSLETLKTDSAKQNMKPITIYIQVRTSPTRPIVWYSITRYNVSSILEHNGIFMYVARPASVEKELNLENDAMRTTLDNHFEFMMGGSIEADAIKYFKSSFKTSPLAEIKELTYTGFLEQMMKHIHPDDIEDFYNQANPENVYDCLNRNENINIYVKYLKNDKYYWYHISIYRFHDNLNTNTHFLFIVYDATTQREKDLRHYEELHWALEQTQLANKAQKEFISNISHEIRTPLNSIQALASLLLQKKDLEYATLRKYAKIIEDSCDHLLHIVNSTLDFSNLSSDTFVYTEDEYNVIDLLNSLQKFVDEKEKKNVTFSFEVEEMLPSTLYGDKIHLEQAIVNVIDNAFKYTSSGNVSVEINWESEYPGEGIIQIDISDTGVGIAPENADAIFEVFRPLDADDQIEHDGIGMGLPITKLILEHMGGSITFESEPDVGTTFHIVVPQTVLDDQPFGTLLEHEEDLYKSTNDFISGKHFMVVDDCRMNLEVMQVILEELGAMSTLCQNAHDAIELLEAGNQYDIIFIDHFMPVMDGIEATHYIRNMDSAYCKEVPIIAFTANAVNNARKMYQNEGMNDLLLKPIDIKKLRKVLKKYL